MKDRWLQFNDIGIGNLDLAQEMAEAREAGQ
jgi:hypothetical protein